MELYDNRKYKVIKSRTLANCIRMILGKPYKTFNDKDFPGRQVFSFENTPEFQRVFDTLNRLIKENRRA